MSLCLQCPDGDKREATGGRGLCPKCYLRSRRRVRARKTTWRKLETAGKAIGESNRFPFQVKKPHGCWLSQELFESNRFGICRTEAAAATRWKIPAVSLRRWTANRCRFNNGEKIFFLAVEPPVGQKYETVRVFPDQTMSPIAERYKKAHQAAGSNGTPEGDAVQAESDDDMLTDRELEEQLGITDGKEFAGYWSEKPSRVRAGEKALRTDEDFVPDARPGPAKKRRSRRGDAKAILNGDESTHPLVGRPAIPRPGALTDEEVEWIIDHFLEKGPLTDDEMRRVLDRYRITDAQAARAVIHLDITRSRVGGDSENSAVYWCAPQKAPRLLHAPILRKAVELIQRMVVEGPEEGIDIQKVVKAAADEGICESKLYEAKPFAGIQTDRARHGQVRYGVWRPLLKPEDRNGASGIQPAAKDRPPAGPPSDAGTENQPAIAARPKLNETQRTIVDAVRDHGPILGENLARKLGFPFNSHFRQTMANLAKFGVIRKGEDGYHV